MARTTLLAAATVAALLATTMGSSAGSASDLAPTPNGSASKGSVVGAGQGMLERGVPTVSAWGPSPRDVPRLLDRVAVVAVAGGGSHDLAVTRGGSVVAWGGNGQHQTDVPAVLDGVAVSQVAAGTGHSLALTAEGDVVAWGWNRYRQTDVPAALDEVVVTEVAAGGRHSLALTMGGSVVGWGSNRHGQTDVPSALDGVVVTQIAAGQASPLGRHPRSAPSHSLALTAAGSVVGWGSNRKGQADVPQALDGVVVTQVAAGGRHSLALTSEGGVVAWGANRRGQADVPAALESVAVIQVAAGETHSLALTADGDVVTWGNRTRRRAARVPAVLAAVKVTEIAAGGRGSLAVGRYEGPDLEVSRRQDGPFKLNNAYDTGGPIDLGGEVGWSEVVGESFCMREPRRHYVRVYNDGVTRASFRLRASSPTPSRVRYYFRRTDITRRLSSRAGLILDIPPHRYRLVKMDLTLGTCPYPRPPSTKAYLTAQLVGHPLRIDRVRAQLHTNW